MIYLYDKNKFLFFQAIAKKLQNNSISSKIINLLLTLVTKNLKKKKLVLKNSELLVTLTSFLLTNQKHCETLPQRFHFISLKLINRYNNYSWYSKVYYVVLKQKSLKENCKHKRHVNSSKEDICHTI